MARRLRPGRQSRGLRALRARDRGAPHLFLGPAVPQLVSDSLCLLVTAVPQSPASLRDQHVPIHPGSPPRPLKMRHTQPAYCTTSYQRPQDEDSSLTTNRPRRDAASGLRLWHDQMESGADNGVLSRCPSARSSCWSAAQALTLASADTMALLMREHTAAALQIAPKGCCGHSTPLTCPASPRAQGEPAHLGAQPRSPRSLRRRRAARLRVSSRGDVATPTK